MYDDELWLCAQVENLVVGAPCGVMDQMASALGKKDSLMALRCQPAQVCASPCWICIRTD